MSRIDWDPVCLPCHIFFVFLVGATRRATNMRGGSRPSEGSELPPPLRRCPSPVFCTLRVAWVKWGRFFLFFLSLLLPSRPPQLPGFGFVEIAVRLRSVGSVERLLQR